MGEVTTDNDASNGAKKDDETSCGQGQGWRPRHGAAASGQGPCSYETPCGSGSRKASSRPDRGGHPCDRRGSPLLWAPRHGSRGSHRGEGRGWTKDVEYKADGNDHRQSASVGVSRRGALPLAFVSIGLQTRAGERGAGPRYSDSESESSGIGKRGLGHESDGGHTGGPRGPKRRFEEPLSSARSSGSRRPRAGKEAGGRSGRCPERERARGEEVQGKAIKKEEEEEKLLQQQRQEGSKKEEEEVARDQCGQRRRKKGEGEGRPAGEGESLEEEQLQFLKRYRRRSSESEEDVQGHSLGPVKPRSQEDFQESSKVHAEKEKQLFRVSQFGGFEGASLENGADQPLRGRAQDKRSLGAIPGSSGLRGPPGNWEDSGLRYGGFFPGVKEMGSPTRAVLPPSPFSPHIWRYGQGAAHTLQCDRRDAGRQDIPGPGYQPTAHQRPGAPGQWDELPSVPEARGHTLGGEHLAYTTGDGNNPKGEESGGQSLRRGKLSEPCPSRKGEDRSERGEDRLQREGRERERKEQDRRKEDRGAQERVLRPSSVDLHGTGVAAPDRSGKIEVSMRGFFPRYEGPKASETILVVDAERLRRSESLSSAIRASVEPRGSFPDCAASSEAGKKDSPLGVRLSRLGSLVCDRFLEVTLHSQSMGKGKPSGIFPLPTSRDRVSNFFLTARPHEVDWVIAVCLALNSYWGGPLINDGEVTKFHGRILESFLHDIHRLDEISDTVNSFEWNSFFRSRTIDYKGEEVKTSKSFCWANIGPALPKEIGIVPLRDVCEQGCRFYVDHFPEFLKDPGEWPAVKNSKVMVSEADWPEVATNLVRCGICGIIPESEVFKVRGSLLLNGLFGVEKGEDHMGTPLYRLIMNLVPLNSLCLGLSADTGGLPHWLGMNPFSLAPAEGLLISSEDVRCFFYTLGLPRCWKPFLAFNREAPRHLWPPGCTEPCYLTSLVLPMGFINSVGIAQHVHRVLVSRSVPRPPSDLPSREIRKDAPLPEASSCWRVYLDNYDLLEKFPREFLTEHRGTLAPEVQGLRGSYW